jgi:hypothetical protein
MMNQTYNASEYVRGGILRGSDADTWGTIDGKPEAYDLIALQRREHFDLFSTFVCEQAFTIFKVFGRFMKVNEQLGGICFMTMLFMSTFIILPR